MKPRQRKRLLEKIKQTLPEILEKHNERRKKINANYSAVYSKSAMPLEHWKVIYPKRKKRDT